MKKQKLTLCFVEKRVREIEDALSRGEDAIVYDTQAYQLRRSLKSVRDKANALLTQLEAGERLYDICGRKNCWVCGGG